MRIDGSPYALAPREHPLEYPGATPPWSYLFLGDSIEPLQGHVGSVGELVVPGEGRLDEVLADRGAAPLASRHVVLAYGSNANPGQLRSKFGEGSAAIPVLRCEVHGWRTAFAARIAGYGSVPATIVPAPSRWNASWLNLLDDEQLVVMDETEGMHFVRRSLHGTPVVRLLDAAEEYDEVLAYATTRALDLDGDGVADPFDPGGQRSVLDHLAPLLADAGVWPHRTTDEVLAAAAARSLPHAAASATMEEHLGVEH